MKLFGNLSPRPPSLVREGGVEVRGGLAPSQKSLPHDMNIHPYYGESKGGGASLINLIPPPFIREGDKAGSRGNRRFSRVLKGVG
jgi:hypothetical protein